MTDERLAEIERRWVCVTGADNCMACEVLQALKTDRAQLEATKSEIQDCRDAWAPDQPPSDLRQFLIDLESVITTQPESHKPPAG
jgi:hypothetical protein